MTSTLSDRVRPGAFPLTPLVGALIGASFFLWIGGWRLASPLEYEWAMKYDWRIHFLGWHLFRTEPWGWPPGLVSGYYHAPDGTSIGYTDSLPIVAFLLKPLSPLLPMPMQYLGLWITGCFAAQGWWGARLAGLWTDSVPAQLFAAILLVLTPTLLNRAVHPALCAHWLLLWAIWLYLKWHPGQPVPRVSMAALGLASGLVHPYLAVMVLALLGAFVARVMLHGPTGERGAAGGVLAGGLAAAGLVVAGWWASGMFIVPGSSMARPGLGLFSMNVLAIVTPSGWSSLLPEVPVGAGGQPFEGFQFLGAGVLLLLVAALAASVLRCEGKRSAASVRFASQAIIPLLVVTGALAIYALGPRITVADHVVSDFSSARLEALAVFGVTGRFFWPATYTLIVLAIRAILGRLPVRTAAAVLAAATVIQVVDLRPGYADRRALTRGADFYTWSAAPRSPVWATALPHYDHIVLLLPAQCGPAPVTFELPAFLAGLYGLTVNVGEVARASEPGRAQYCAELEQRLSTGAVDDRTVYLVHPGHESRLRAAAPSLHCGTLDGIRVCVTARSYEAWRGAAQLE